MQALIPDMTVLVSLCSGDGVAEWPNAYGVTWFIDLPWAIEEVGCPWYHFRLLLASMPLHQ